jgi:hypothetical protein
MTLLEQANRIDPGGDLATIAEVLDENNPIIQDMPMVEANDTFVHSFVKRLSLPSGSVRGMNEGVSEEQSQTVVEKAEMAIIEGRSKIDIKIVDNAPNPKAFRMQEARAFLEGMAQTHADMVLYGNNQDEPKEINGFFQILNSLAATTNVIGASGTGSDTTSILVVQWGAGQVYGIYPRGSKSMGIEHKDLGVQTVTDANSKRFEAYEDVFTLWTGICINDERCVGRIANIESSGSSNIFDEDDLITLLNRMKNGGRGATIYCNDTVKTQMEILLKDKANVNFTPGRGEGLAGQEMLYFRGHPVKLLDAIVNTETAIS